MMWARSNRALLAAAVSLTAAALACSFSFGTTPTPAPSGGGGGGGGNTAVPSGGLATATSSGGGQATEKPTEAPKAGGGINASNVANLKESQSISASKNSVLAGGLSPTVHQGATFGTDLFVRFWDVDSGKKLQELPGHSAYGFALSYSPDGKMVATGGGFQVIVWDSTSGKQLRSITTNAYVFRITWSPDSSKIAVVGDGSSKIGLYDPKSGKLIKNISTDSGRVLWAAEYSPDGKNLAVSDYKGYVTLFAGDGNSVVWSAQGAGGATWDLAYSPDGKFVTACNGNGDIATYNTSDGSPYSPLTLSEFYPGGCTDGVFSKSADVYFSVGKQSASGGTGDFTLDAWDVKTGKSLYQKHYTVGIWTVSLSGDGELLALAMDNGDFRVLTAK